MTLEARELLLLLLLPASPLPPPKQRQGSPAQRALDVVAAGASACARRTASISPRRVHPPRTAATRFAGRPVLPLLGRPLLARGRNLSPPLHCRRKIHATDRPGSAALPPTAVALLLLLLLDPRPTWSCSTAALLLCCFCSLLHRRPSSSTSSLRAKQGVCVRECVWRAFRNPSSSRAWVPRPLFSVTTGLDASFACFAHCARSLLD